MSKFSFRKSATGSANVFRTAIPELGDLSQAEAAALLRFLKETYGEPMLATIVDGSAPAWVIESVREKAVAFIQTRRFFQD